MSYYDYGYGFYTPTKPKEVKDGIKLQSSKVGSTWWSKKWISALESFTNTNRLERGRRYARKGQVMNFNISSDGSVSAKVQGSASRPYSISIKIKTFSDNEWANIFKEMSNQALFLARLLNGEMPEDIDEVFSRAGVSLFPNSRNQITTNCSCPDSANPCKHIAAVHYVLGEEFDRDPFMLFKLRGRSEEQVTSELRRLRSFDSKTGEEASSQEAEKEYEVTSLREGLSDFWFLGDEFNKISVSVTPPTVPLAIITRLGAPGFWQEDDFEAVMEKIYGIMSDSAIKEAYSAVSEGMRQAGEKTSAGDVTLNNIILHGTWVSGDGTPGGGGSDGKFFVWGEKIKAAAATESGVKKKPGRRKKGEKAQAKTPEHPFCISAGELVEITKNLGFNFNSGECSQGSLIVSLPASGNAPRESFKRLIEATENAPETLSEWTVPAVEVSAREAARQLAHLPFNDVSYNYGDINVNIKFGGDVLFWSCLAKFGFELIARQRFIPSITESTGVEEESKGKNKRVNKSKGDKEGNEGNDLKKLNLCAVWHPVYNYDEDSKRINLFVNSMPYVCAAAAKTGDEVLEKFSPAKLIMNFLNKTVDETCRSWFKNKIARTGTWENKISKDTVSSRWLSALCSPDGKVTGTTHQLNVLKSGVDKWSNAIKTSGSKMPFRTCFRLEEPCEESIDVYGDEHEKQEWSISFHLQSIADQSLLVPAEKIWKSKSVKYLAGNLNTRRRCF